MTRSAAGGRAPSSALSIAIPTFRRPDALGRALRGVLTQAAVHCPEGTEVLVVDNDPAGSARAVVDALGDAERRGVTVRYVQETAPGVAAVRNRALDEVSSSDLLLFIDDDEEPEAGWLSTLLATRAHWGAEAVAGLVVPHYDVEPDQWVRAGRFFDRQNWPTGTMRPVAATNNLLLDLHFVRAHGLRFDEAFGTTGGEDTLFTRQLVVAGGSIVWCGEARVRDHVPVERLDHAWILRRQRSHAATSVRVDLALAGPGTHLTRRYRALVGGVGRIAVGLVRHATGVLTGSVVHRARGARLMARGRGLAAAAIGRGVHSEYGGPR